MISVLGFAVNNLKWVHEYFGEHVSGVLISFPAARLRADFIFLPVLKRNSWELMRLSEVCSVGMLCWGEREPNLDHLELIIQ